MALGIVPEAQAAAAVLGHNFPNSEWYKRSYALLKSGGVSPQIDQRHLVQQDAEGADARRQHSRSSSRAGASRKPPARPAVARGHAGAASAERRADVSSAPSRPPLGLRAEHRSSAAGLPAAQGLAFRASAEAVLPRMKATGCVRQAGRQADRGGGEGRARAPRRRDRAPRRALLPAGRAGDLRRRLRRAAPAQRGHRGALSRRSCAPTARPSASAPRRSRPSARCAMPCRCSRSATPSPTRTWPISSPASAASWGSAPTRPSR